MPRKGAPWFRKTRGRWFCTIGGRQHPLTTTDPNDLAAAVAERQALVDALASAVAARLTPGHQDARTVKDAVAAFLSHQATRQAAGLVKAETLRCYRTALKPLVDSLGARPLAAVNGAEFEAWAARPKWSNTTRSTYLSVVLSLLRWANVSTKVNVPPVESRGADTCLTDDQFAAVLAALPKGGTGKAGDLRELLSVLRETGARPQEMAGLTAELVDWENGCARLSQHKGRRHTAKRVIYFNTAAVAVLEAQRARYSSGLLFRTRYGRRYQGRSIIKSLRGVSKKLGIRVIAYGLRHSFATRALVAGVPDAIVAELLGHRGTAMITAHYGHVGSHSRVLRDAAEKVSRKAG